MERKPGYHTITYRFRLYCEHKDWLVETRQIYNQVLSFYYGVLQKEPEVAQISSKQKLLRQLELLTVGARGQEKGTVEHPLPYEKVPLYFRRAAANDAIRIYRSYMARQEISARYMENKKEHGGENPAIEPQDGIFQASPIFYKGMYKDFTEFSISLKLWNGEKWVWEKCELDTCRRKLPEAAQMLSPVLKLNGSRAMLHVPVREEVEDVRTVKERLLGEEVICAAAFPNNDCLAVLAVMDKEGKCMESLFIRGGKQFAHEKKKLLNRIRKNRASMGADSFGRELPEDENKYLKEKIRNLSEDYAHKVSRQIVEFCESRNIGILVVPNYHQTINLNQMGYLPATSYDWIGRRIIQYLRYKAFGKGIVVTSVSTKGIASTCHVCGEPVQRFNKNNKPSRNYYGGKNYICPNGHKGNAGLNSAMNIGKHFFSGS